ncbi:MAG: cysteine--tRNA ligase [Patescibacteria group bacterium]
MALRLFNTLGREKQEFVPIGKKEVRMYSCGPTVYNYLHIGNLRSYVFADVLKRTLMYSGYKVKHIMNITDVGHLTSDADEGDDKMVKALKREGKPMTIAAMREIANTYYEKARIDMQKLEILSADEYPFATDHIKEMVAMIEVLLEKNAAYKTADSIYFDTKSIPDYGKLAKVKANDEHSRIGVNSEKKNLEDFALWKFADAGGIGFEASFGRGFPGWHIECSAMAEKYLGVPFDIHTGGIDHIPVHHNNEIAQTEAATGKLLANYWLHNAHLTIGEEKMAKSGEFLTLSVLEKEGISPLAYRYWLLTARYSTRMDYSLEAIKAAQTAYEKLVNFILSAQKTTFWAKLKPKRLPSGFYREKFLEAINDDLDTPKALALVWELLKDGSLPDTDKKATLLDFDKVLGLGLADIKKLEIPEEIQNLLDERKIARNSKDWVKSDELRKEIEKLGFAVKDSDSGSELRPL